MLRTAANTVAARFMLVCCGHRPLYRTQLVAKCMGDEGSREAAQHAQTCTSMIAGNIEELL